MPVDITMVTMYMGLCIWSIVESFYCVHVPYGEVVSY